MRILHKKLLYCILLINVIIISCKKTLDVIPNNSFTDATAFTTPDRIEAAMNGVYDAAQSGFYNLGAVRGYPFGAANIQQGDLRGEDMVNEALFYQVTYESTYGTVSANNEFMFNTLYALINKANLTIEGVKKAVTDKIINDAKGNQYEAESRFLRAMANHELLINFARPYADGNGSQQGIVYRDFGIASDAELEAAKALTRSTVAENYTAILQDLDYAEANLPAITPDLNGSGKTYRASKGAAIALKMRIKLHKGDWAGVITEGGKLVPAGAGPYVSPIGNWKLTANPGDPFVIGSTSDESIFSIRNASSDNGGNNGGLGNMYGSPANNGRGLVRVSPIIYNIPAWRCDDKRRSLLTAYTAAGKTNYLTTKYKETGTIGTDAAPQVRYAEVLLTLAEAEARSAAGVSGRALELLNAVRNRSLTTPVTQQYLIGDFATKNDLIKSILVERRIEFLAEGKRWGDIHRLAKDPDFSTGGIPAKIGTGSATTAMYSCGAGSSTYTTAIGAIPYADFRFLWPIPLSETQQNPNFAQNLGY